MPKSSTVPDLLGVDARTIKDLEIFDPDTSDSSLFDFCIRTRPTPEPSVSETLAEDEMFTFGLPHSKNCHPYLVFTVTMPR